MKATVFDYLLILFGTAAVLGFCSWIFFALVTVVDIQVCGTPQSPQGVCGAVDAVKYRPNPAEAVHK